MTKISKGLYLYGLTAILALASIFRLIGYGMARMKALKSIESKTPLLSLSMFLFVVGFVLVLILFYKAWSAIQDGHARTTPGKAVGFSFIPIYNFYWVFVAIAGWAKDFNAFAERHKLPIDALKTGIFTSLAVFWLIGWLRVLKVLWVVAAFVLVVLQYLVSARVIAAVNAIPAIEGAADANIEMPAADRPGE